MPEMPLSLASAREAREEHLACAGLALSTFGWASAFIAGKVLMAEMTALPAAAFRYGVATAVLLPFAILLRPQVSLRPLRMPLLLMTVCGGVIYP